MATTQKNTVLYFIETDGRRDAWLPKWGKPSAKKLREVLAKAGKTSGTYRVVCADSTVLCEVVL